MFGDNEVMVIVGAGAEAVSNTFIVSDRVWPRLSVTLITGACVATLPAGLTVVCKTLPTKAIDRPSGLVTDQVNGGVPPVAVIVAMARPAAPAAAMLADAGEIDVI